MSLIGDQDSTREDENDDTKGNEGTKEDRNVIFKPFNPYHFPERHLFQGLTFDGLPVFTFPIGIDPVTQAKRVRNLAMREDDILINAYPKSGTHWVSEILHMLTRGTTDYAPNPKEFAMLEMTKDLTTLDQMKSPRILNSHFYIAQLPKQVFEKKVKLVHLIRNPKDCALSYFNHMKQNAPKEFNFDNYIKGYITEGYMTRSHQPNFLRQFSKFEGENPDHPIIHIHYEDLKREPVPVLQELARFVNIQVSTNFCQDVAEACGLDKLKRADLNRSLPEHLSQIFPNGFSAYQQGIVGNWKSTFTVAQNEMFDQFLAEQEEKGIGYEFRWK